MPSPHLYLASASPRRAELLTQLGVRFEVVSQDIDESVLSAESPQEYTKRLALAKAQAGLDALGSSSVARPVLGSDTCVVAEQAGQFTILGKPKDKVEALEMLALLSGSRHQVMTAVALVDGAKQVCLLNTSVVCFSSLSSEQMEAYWRSGEPQGKAGGYAIQGMAAQFIEHLSGSFSGVMGLPLYETAQLLKQFGIDPLMEITTAH